jgi:hypothetical protein
MRSADFDLRLQLTNLNDGRKRTRNGYLIYFRSFINMFTKLHLQKIYRCKTIEIHLQLYIKIHYNTCQVCVRLEN